MRGAFHPHAGEFPSLGEQGTLVLQPWSAPSLIRRNSAVLAGLVITGAPAR